MANILIIMLSMIIATGAGRVFEKLRLKEVEKNKNNSTITYDKYFLGVIGGLLVTFYEI